MNRVLLREEIERRRVLAIISHPDAGKTTITEKLLLLGNLIKIAGTIKSKKADRHATSDWMTMEPVSYTHLRAHETSLHLVWRLVLEKK